MYEKDCDSEVKFFLLLTLHCHWLRGVDFSKFKIQIFERFQNPFEARTSPYIGTRKKVNYGKETQVENIRLIHSKCSILTNVDDIYVQAHVHAALM